MKINFLCILFLLPFFGYSQKQFDVFFDFNQDFPNQQSILKINEWIAKNKDVEILKLEGFCDSIDTKDYNIKLAERRIENVQILLTKSELKFSDKLEKIPFGKDFKQSKIQAENRKVTVYFNVLKHIESEFTTRLKNAKTGETIKLPNIYFYNNSARIVPKSLPILTELLCALEENPNLKIEIQGHICCQKVFDLNGVSVARAKAIYNYLAQKKINKKRLTYKGYGTSRPIYPIPENNEAERDENRRVEILIVEK
jgi:outer membrane protein OmpA-like peptidoglycan-associated protein